MAKAPTCSECKKLAQALDAENARLVRQRPWVTTKGRDGLWHACPLEPGGTVGFAALCGCIPSAPLGP